MEYKTNKRGQLMDENYYKNMFQRDMGEPDMEDHADKETIEAYRGKLPNELLKMWEEHGWCSYANGMLWLINPSEYETLVQTYLKGSSIASRELYAVARTAFGEVYLWERGKGNVADIGLLANLIMLDAVKDRQDLTREEEEFEMVKFIGLHEPYTLDCKDSNRQLLFDRALKKFGRLENNEMYGYKLNPAMGGKKSITNLDKVDLFVYADIQRQLEKPDFAISDTENNTITY